MLFAALALDWSSNMIAVSNAVAFLNMLGVATLFVLLCLVSVFYEVWSDCSVLVSSAWFFLSVLVWQGSCCPCVVVLV